MAHTSETLRLAFKYLFPDELTALKDLAQMLPSDPLVINIGAGAGTSGLAFLESRADLTLYTVDIQEDDSPFGCLIAEARIIAAATVEKCYPDSYKPRWGQYHMDSKMLASIWVFNPVDMVFIDGDHSYEGCKGDILGWLPHIKKGGILAIHDYAKEQVYALPHRNDVPHEMPWPGVDQAVDELLLGKYEQILKVDTLIAFKVK